MSDDSETLDPLFLATEQLLVDELGATELVVRVLDDGIYPSPLWVAQARWVVPIPFPIGPAIFWGVDETETTALCAVADAILQERLCPYCHQRTRLWTVEVEPSGLSPDEERELLAADAERSLGQPIALECSYDWDPAKARFILCCAEGST
jgi:hypothetical protein